MRTGRVQRGQKEVQCTDKQEDERTGATVRDDKEGVSQDIVETTEASAERVPVSV